MFKDEVSLANRRGTVRTVRSDQELDVMPISPILRTSRLGRRMSDKQLETDIRRPVKVLGSVLVLVNPDKDTVCRVEVVGVRVVEHVVGLSVQTGLLPCGPIKAADVDYKVQKLH